MRRLQKISGEPSILGDEWNLFEAEELFPLQLVKLRDNVCKRPLNLGDDHMLDCINPKNLFNEISLKLLLVAQHLRFVVLMTSSKVMKDVCKLASSTSRLIAFW